MLKTPLITAYDAETHLTKKKREGKDDRQRPRVFSGAHKQSLKRNSRYLKVRKKPEEERKNGAKLKCQGLGVWKIIRRAVVIKARLIAADRITFSRHQDNKTPFLLHTRAHTPPGTHKMQDRRRRSGSIAVGRAWTI